MKLAACRGDCNQGRRPCSNPMRCSDEGNVLAGLPVHRFAAMKRETHNVPGWWERLMRILQSLPGNWSARRADLHFVKRARRRQAIPNRDRLETTWLS